MNVKVHKITSSAWNFHNFTCVSTILVKFDIHFQGLPWEIFFGVITDDKLHLQAWKNVKKNTIILKLFWNQLGWCFDSSKNALNNVRVVGALSTGYYFFLKKNHQYSW